MACTPVEHENEMAEPVELRVKLRLRSHNTGVYPDVEWEGSTLDIIVGRQEPSSEADVQINDPYVSASHATITVLSETDTRRTRHQVVAVILDQSSNGVYVNDIRIGPYKTEGKKVVKLQGVPNSAKDLRVGDKITFSQLPKNNSQDPLRRNLGPVHYTLQEASCERIRVIPPPGGSSQDFGSQSSYPPATLDVGYDMPTMDGDDSDGSDEEAGAAPAPAATGSASATAKKSTSSSSSAKHKSGFKPISDSKTLRKYGQFTRDYTRIIKTAAGSAAAAAAKKAAGGDEVIFDEAGDLLGKGSYAKVYKVKSHVTGEVFACKDIALSDNGTTAGAGGGRAGHDPLAEEIEILKACKNPNVVRFVDAYKESITVTKLVKDPRTGVRSMQTVPERHLYMILEYINNGELFTKLLSKHRFPEWQTCDLFKQILKGVDHLHSKGICHRDLKPENLLLHKWMYYPRPDEIAKLPIGDPARSPYHRYLLKITDFGMSRIIQQEATAAALEFSNTPPDSAASIGPGSRHSSPGRHGRGRVGGQTTSSSDGGEDAELSSQLSQQQLQLSQQSHANAMAVLDSAVMLRDRHSGEQAADTSTGRKAGKGLEGGAKGSAAKTQSSDKQHATSPSSAATPLSRAKSIVGTPEYIPPEIYLRWKSEELNTHDADGGSVRKDNVPYEDTITVACRAARRKAVRAAARHILTLEKEQRGDRMDEAAGAKKRKLEGKGTHHGDGKKTKRDRPNFSDGYQESMAIDAEDDDGDDDDSDGTAEVEAADEDAVQVKFSDIAADEDADIEGGAEYDHWLIDGPNLTDDGGAVREVAGLASPAADGTTVAIGPAWRTDPRVPLCRAADLVRHRLPRDVVALMDRADAQRYLFRLKNAKRSDAGLPPLPPSPAVLAVEEAAWAASSVPIPTVLANTDIRVRPCDLDAIDRVMREGYDGFAMDSWSLGVILFVLLSGNNMFPFKDGEDVDPKTGCPMELVRLLTCQFTFFDASWEGVSMEARDLIMSLCRINPMHRLTPYQALHHPWILKLKMGQAPHPDTLPARRPPKAPRRSKRSTAALVGIASAPSSVASTSDLPASYHLSSASGSRSGASSSTPGTNTSSSSSGGRPAPSSNSQPSQLSQSSASSSSQPPQSLDLACAVQSALLAAGARAPAPHPSSSAAGGAGGVGGAAASSAAGGAGGVASYDSASSGAGTGSSGSSDGDRSNGVIDLTGEDENEDEEGDGSEEGYVSEAEGSAVDEEEAAVKDSCAWNPADGFESDLEADEEEEYEEDEEAEGDDDEDGDAE